jgi:pyruvate kinase
VLDGADAVMLSGETAVGKNPARVVDIMSRIVVTAEESPRASYALTGDFLATHGAQDFQNAVSLAAVRAASELQAEAIIVYTTSGATARLVSDYRPNLPILALVPNIEQQRRLQFAWGVRTAVVPPPSTPEELFEATDRVIAQENLAQPGETVVVVSKVPMTANQRTNSLHLYMVGTSAAMR